MARYDKYNGETGGFRAALAEDWEAGDVATPVAVGLDADGRLVKGAGNTGVLGVYVDDGVTVGGQKVGHKAGHIADTMTSGEIVDVEDLDAGTAYFGSDTGEVGDAGVAIGHTVEADRLVVRVTKGASA